MPPPKQPPPSRPLGIAVVLRDLNIFIPVAAIVVVVLGASGVGMVFHQQSEPPVPDIPADVPPGWMVASHGPVLSALATAAVGELPPAIKGQRSPPCDPDLERAIRGACWVPVDVEKCPIGKAYVHDKGSDADGKCYARAMKAERTPTSGEPRHTGVAGP